MLNAIKDAAISLTIDADMFEALVKTTRHAQEQKVLQAHATMNRKLAEKLNILHAILTQPLKKQPQEER